MFSASLGTLPDVPSFLSQWLRSAVARTSPFAAPDFYNRIRVLGGYNDPCPVVITNNNEFDNQKQLV